MSSRPAAKRAFGLVGTVTPAGRNPRAVTRSAVDGLGQGIRDVRLPANATTSRRGRPGPTGRSDAGSSRPTFGLTVHRAGQERAASREAQSDQRWGGSTYESRRVQYPALHTAAAVTMPHGAVRDSIGTTRGGWPRTLFMTPSRARR